jgi:hypothetical protein
MQVDTFWGGLVVGILGALVATFILWLSRAGVERGLLSVSRRLAKEQVIDLSGTWRSDTVDKREHPYTYREDITLKQEFTRIEGKIEYYETGREPGSETVHKSFQLKGIYRERSLAAFYRSADKGSTSIGCISMQLVGGRMVGGCIYYDDDRNRVINDTYSWTRL